MANGKTEYNTDHTTTLSEIRSIYYEDQHGYRRKLMLFDLIVLCIIQVEDRDQ